MPKGRIKYYNLDKGFGFIAQDSGEADVFLHSSAIREWESEAIQVGQRIKYDVVKGKKGLVAKNAQILLTPMERKWLRQGKAIIPRGYAGRFPQEPEDELDEADEADVESIRETPPPPKRPEPVPQPKLKPTVEATQPKPKPKSDERPMPQAIESDTRQERIPVQQADGARGESKSTFGDLYIQKQIRLKTPMVFGLYDQIEHQAIISKFTKYTFTLRVNGTEQEYPKTDIKYCYKTEEASQIESLMHYDEKVKAQQLTPVVPRKERYIIDTQEVWDARKERYPIEVTMREGEIFRGLVDWVSQYEIKLILENDAKVVVFRHAICGFKAFPDNDDAADG
jgi:cold shock protein